jgi:hypothetical protein
MELMNAIQALAEKIKQQGAVIQTEEATKNAFIMPFLSNVLGYDVFDPTEVVPEYVCDIGTKKGEKIDYAIFRDGSIQILFECKKFGEPLNIKHASQLFRYFHVANARIGVLTNGQVFWFFTDLDAPNKMDEKPFLVLDILDIDEHTVPELSKLTKSAFNLESVINAAGELKYVGQLKKELASELTSPSEELTKLLTARVYDGSITQKVREQFSGLLKKAIGQYLSDQVNDRLKSAISSPNPTFIAGSSDPASEESAGVNENQDNENKIITTVEELEGFYIVKSIVRTVINGDRIVHRDSQSYLAILVDDNNRKTICRLHFNREQKYIGLLDEQKKETRHPIGSLDDIYTYADALRSAAASLV